MRCVSVNVVRLNVPEQNVVNGTSNLAHVDEGVRLHVLLTLELHLAVVALDLLGTDPTPLHVVCQARSGLLVFLAFGALLLFNFVIAAATALFLFSPRTLGRLQAFFDQCFFRMDLFPMRFEVADRASRVTALGLVTAVEETR